MGFYTFLISKHWQKNTQGYNKVTETSWIVEDTVIGIAALQYPSHNVNL